MMRNSTGRQSPVKLYWLGKIYGAFGKKLVARIYAGILGPLALVTCVARGLLHGSGVESTLLSAWLSLLVFSAVGYVIGRLAEWIVDESVGAVVQAELAAENASKS